MQKLIVLGASRGTLQLIETAQDMGIYSILVGPEGHSELKKKMLRGGVFLPVSVNSTLAMR